MTNIKIINDRASLERLCQELEDTQAIALDTEFMREKTFAPILCLIQLSSDRREFCVDPLQVDNLEALGELLATPTITTILHSCRQDLEAMDTRAIPPFAKLFDTQLGAAFCGYGDQVSYAALVEEIAGVKLAKSHTRADWQARPLSGAELEYAMDDVRYLEVIQHRLTDELEAAGRYEWFCEECARQLEPESWRIDPEDAWKRLKGGANLPPEAQETARRLTVWRERQATERNRPREWVLSTAALLQISRNHPTNKSQLAEVDGLNSGILRHAAEPILEICAQTPRDANADPLWMRHQMLDPEQKQRAKGIMKLLREAAEELEISASLLSNRSAVERYVRGNVEIDLFRGWRREVIGERVLRDFS